MPIDEVGEGSFPAKGVYGSLFFMRTEREGQLTATFFSLLGGPEGDSTGQRAELQVTRSPSGAPWPSGPRLHKQAD